MSSFATRARRAAGAWASALVLALAPGASSAVLYKWVDGRGHVSFSDHPPPEKPPGGVQTMPDPRPIPTSKAKAEAEAAKRTAVPPGTEHYTCAQAKAKVAMHERNLDQDMYAPETDGSFKHLSREEVQGIVDAWRAVAETVCKREAAKGGSAGG